MKVKVGKRLELIDTRKDVLNIKAQVFFSFLFKYMYVSLRAEGERRGRERSGEKCIAQQKQLNVNHKHSTGIKANN